VDDKPLVSVLDSSTNVAKKTQPMRNVQLMLIAVTVNGNPFNQFHHEIRGSFIRRATIHQPRDVGMVKTGQNLSLVAEAFEQGHCIPAATYYLDRHLFRVLTVCPDGAIHLSHPTTPKFRDDVVRSEATAQSARPLCPNIKCGNFQEFVSGFLMRNKEGLDFNSKIFITCANLVQILRAPPAL
jgi:hypothetical protein